MAERTSALHRFFVEPGTIAGDSARIVGAHAHQLARVLRVRPGEQVVLLDGTGTEQVVELVSVAPKVVEGVVRESRPSRGEPRLTVVLYQGLVAREKLETVIQKGTEVGVASFVPVRCERSGASRGEAVDERRLERWRRIATEAAEQSGRGVVPEVRTLLAFADALAEAVAAGPALVAWEGERGRSVAEGLRAARGEGQAPPPPKPGELSSPPGLGGGGATHLSLFVGPEGGFAPREVERAVELGALTVSLGPRILRTETAGPVLAALALYEAGEMMPITPATERGSR